MVSRHFELRETPIFLSVIGSIRWLVLIPFTAGRKILKKLLASVEETLLCQVVHSDVATVAASSQDEHSAANDGEGSQGHADSRPRVQQTCKSNIVPKVVKPDSNEGKDKACHHR